MTRRRIIFDVSMAKSGGGYTYAVNIVPPLARQMPHAELLVVVSGRRLAESLPAIENVKIHVLPEQNPIERIRFLVAGAASLARRFAADAYFSASELTPALSTCPKVAAFRNPNLFTSLELSWPWYQRARIGTLYSLAVYSARTCARVMFVSHDSARWIGDSLDIPHHRRVVIPHGINPDLWSGHSGDRPLVRPFILSVSDVYRYKNYVRLIEAWTALASRWADVPDLAIVGGNRDPHHYREMAAARLRAGANASRIHLLGEVPYYRVSHYYEHAEAFVFPSYLETFGHPLLEAMAAGLPVVASDIGVFREIAESAAVYCEPLDVDSIANALERVLRDATLRSELSKKGRERIRLFSWDKASRGLVAMLDDVISEYRPR